MQKENISVLAREFKRTGEGRPARTTLVLSEKLNFALEIYAFKTGTPKGEIVRTAIRNYLMEKGINPSKIPKMIDRTMRSVYPTVRR